jgi:hypothetical protein
MAARAVEPADVELEQEHFAKACRHEFWHIEPVHADGSVCGGHLCMRDFGHEGNHKSTLGHSP